MKSLRKNYPILVSIVLILLFFLAQGLMAAAAALLPVSIAPDDYPLIAISELVSAAVMLLAAMVLGVRPLFNWRRVSRSQVILPCLALFLIYLIALLESMILSMGQSLVSAPRIVFFVLAMFLTGLAEELLFRGLVLRSLYEKYGNTYAGIWFAVLTSSLLFGLVHLANLAAAEPGGVLIQVVGAAALGICLGAVYLRSGSLWTVVALHGFMDFSALFASGFFGDQGVMDTVSAYESVKLVSVLLYLALGLFLLRPSRTKTLTDPSRPTSNRVVMGLMLVIFLLSGLCAAVTVWSI